MLPTRWKKPWSFATNEPKDTQDRQEIHRALAHIATIVERLARGYESRTAAWNADKWS